jgi:RNA polymerase sigma-70 factor (ECF subfamily)
MTKSDEIAKDIIQDVFLKLWEQKDSIASIDNMEAWLYRLTENKVIDFLRKTATDNKLKDVVWNNVQEIVNEAELHSAAKEYNQIIRSAIEQLPPQRKLIYKLNKEEGMNYQEIADHLHISKHTVKNQLYTAVQSVRGFLTKNVGLFSFFAVFS